MLRVSSCKRSAMPWKLWGSGAEGQLDVGEHEDAMVQGYDQVVNAADLDYDSYDPSKRFWLNIGFGGNQIPESAGSPFSWTRRMARAVELCLIALIAGGKALVHCRQGKHRSGTFASVVLAVLLDLSLDDAVEMYFRERPLVLKRDQAIVWKIIAKRGIREWLDGFRAQFDTSRLMEEANSKKRQKNSEALKLPARKRPKQQGSEVPTSSEVPKLLPLQAKSAPALPPASSSGVPRRAASSATPSSSEVPPWRAASSATPSSSGVPPCPVEEDLWEEDQWEEVEAEEVRDARLPEDGAWECPGCASMNLRSKMRCPCGCLRPLVQDWRDGDWTCRDCGNHNFKWRKDCANTHCPTMVVKPGDWVCSRCGNHNFSKNKFCNTKWCRQRKPS